MKGYFSYFKFLFITLGVVALLTAGVGITRLLEGGNVRVNMQAPSQRVYDYGDVLSDSEEDKLTELIEKRQLQIGCDIVLVTVNESLYSKYGITEDTNSNWEYAMMNYADDFYDQMEFGFDKVHGDGVLLLDNWYQGEEGSWLSTCGKVYNHYNARMVDKVLDDVYNLVDDSPYRAYVAYVEDIYKEMAGVGGGININPFIILALAVFAAGFFIIIHLRGKEGKKTTVASTYVENGSVRFNVKRDELVNKFVTSRVIPQNTGSSSSGGRSGGHTSSGGVSHGGGGRRR